MAPEEPAGRSFDPDALLEALDRHGVEYLIVGGVAARAHGASRPTADLDVIPSDTAGNLDRLAAALRSMNARLRVGGMTDDEARQLPVEIDEATLRAFGSSTWMTDEGPLDVLGELRGAGGESRTYGDLVSRSSTQRAGAITVRVIGLDDLIQAKEFAGRQKDVEALPELRALRDRSSGEPT